MTERMSLSLAQADPEVAAAIDHETLRQHEGLEMIASENFVSEAVLEAAGSVFTNKYAEGYPGRRYYGGCEYADVVENLARDRAKQIFDAEFANVQPHSGSQANAVGVYGGAASGRHDSGARPGAWRAPDARAQAELQRASCIGPTFYTVRRDTETIDYDELEAIATREKPKAIIGGASAYPRLWDFARMRQIADKVGAVYIFDMAHIAGLVAGGAHPSPVPHAHITTTTTHKTLRGPRAGLILRARTTRWARSRNRRSGRRSTWRCFRGSRAGRWCTLWRRRRWRLARCCGRSSRRMRRRLWPTRRRWARHCSAAGFRLVSGGTDNHLMLVDVFEKGILGSEAELALGKAGITVNKNAIPYDTNPPLKPSGIRVGTPALTTRGMKEAEMRTIATWIAQALEQRNDDAALERIRGEVAELANQFPLYAWRLKSSSEFAVHGS